MNRLILIFIVSLICGAVFTGCNSKHEKSSNKKTTWKYDGLTGKGKVKSMRNVGYTVISDSGQLHKGEIITDEWGYNNFSIEYTETGLWTEYNSYKPDGSSIRREISIYDDAGNAVEMQVYNFGTFDHKRVYTNDSRGNIIKTIRYTAADSLVSTIIYKYDENDNNIKIRRYNAADSLISKTLNKFDKNNNCIESVIYNSDSSLSSKILNKYNSSGNIIEKIDYNSVGELITQTAYQYNDKGFLTETNIYNSTDNSNQKTAYEYKYDFNDNWIERIEYINDIAVKITERQIVYY